MANSISSYPVVLARGARLLEAATGVPRLGFAVNQFFRSGIVLVRFVVDESL
jgi:hypothetical protein